MARPVSIKYRSIKTLIPSFILAITGSVSTSIHAEEALIIGNWCDGSSFNNCDAAFRVDLITGKRTLFSALTDADRTKAFDESNSQFAIDSGGTYWNTPVISASGEIYIYSSVSYSSGENAIHHISPITGARRRVSNLGDITAGPLVNGEPDTMVITPENKILVQRDSGKVISIDPATGKRFTLSDATITSQGAKFEKLYGISRSGIFWGDSFNYPNQNLIQFDTVYGQRTALKDDYLAERSYTYFSFNNRNLPILDADNKIFTFSSSLYESVGMYNSGNPAIDSSLLSDFRNLNQGPVIERVVARAWDSSGRIIVVDNGEDNKVNLGGLFAIDPTTGNRTLISNFTDSTQGPLIFKARALAVGTMPAFVGASGNTGGNGGGSSSGTEPTLSITESADPVQSGQPFSYTVTFTNNAASAATNVKLTNTLSKKSKLVSKPVSSQGKCTVKAPAVCNFRTVAAGVSVNATFTVTRKNPGSVKNSAKLSYKMVKAGSKRNKSYKLSKTENTAVN